MSIALDQFIADELRPIQTCVQVDLRTPQQRIGCACYEHAGPRECYDLRYYGRSPVSRGPGSYDIMDEIAGEPDLEYDDGECDCCCHEDEYEDDDEDWR